MNVRVLPPEEWPRLTELQQPQFVEYVQPEDIDVVVVEEAGKIVATMSVLRAVHIEGTWIDPEHRNPGVRRGLLRLAGQVARDRGARWAFTGAADEQTKRMLDKHATRLEMDTYVMSLGG